MAKFLKARTQRKIRKTIKRTTWFVIISCVLLASSAAWTIVDTHDLDNRATNFFASMQKGDGYPIILDDMKVENLLLMGEDIAVITHGGNYIFNANGAKMLVDFNTYSYPLTVGTDAKLLVYDVGGKSYHINNKVERVIEGLRNNRILVADIAENGAFAIAEECKGYLGQVTAFDIQGNEIYNWQTNQGYMYLLEMWQDGRGFAAVSSNAVAGRLQSNISFNCIYEDKESVTWNLVDEMVLSIAWTTNETLRVLTNKNIRSYDKYGKELAIVPQDEDISVFENDPNGNLYIAVGDYHSAEGMTMKAYDATLRPIGEWKIVGEEILEIKQDEDKILLLTESNLYLADKYLNQVKQRKAAGLTHIELKGNHYYGIGSSGLLREEI